MPATYFEHLLLFGLPVLAGQAVALALLNKRRVLEIWRRLLAPVLGLAAWLSLADALAIRAGLWRFGPGTNSGLAIGPVPVEEIVFFVIANALVAQGLALSWGPNLWRRSRYHHV
jgi:putative membrane protein